jgi:hypothetical protein
VPSVNSADSAPRGLASRCLVASERLLWVAEPLPRSLSSVTGRTWEPLTAQTFTILGWNMLGHHRLVNAPVAVPTSQRGGHPPPSRLKLALGTLLGRHRLPRHLTSLSNDSRVPIVMFPERRQLLIGGAFELVVGAMVTPLAAMFLTCWCSEYELNPAAFAGGAVILQGLAGVSHCKGVHELAAAPRSFL